MANPIKYNTSAETLALKKGNFYIGTGDVGKGPTSSTGYYNGVTPPSGGYTIYLNKASDGPAIYTVSTEAQLTSLTNRIAGTNYTTSGECLNYFATQTDKMIFNRDYTPIITNGLVLNMDAGFTPSYPTTGTTWYDLGPSGSNGTLTNGPTYNSDNGGSIVFDGSDDYVVIDVNSFIRNNVAYTFNCFFYYTGGSGGGAPYNIITMPFTDQDGDGFWQHLKLGGINNSWLWRTEDNISGEYGGEVITPNPFSDNNFYYLTSVVKTDTILYYLNGILQATINTSFQWSRLRNDRTANIFIGAGYGTSYQMPGRVNIFSLYNRELSATEILQNYFATVPIVRNGLVLNLEAGNATSYVSGSKTWVDTAGITTGTLTNGPTFSSSGASSSIVFDGVDDAVIWNSNPLSSLTSAKTYELWVKFDSSLVNTFTISCGTYMVYLEAKNTWYVNQAGASNAYLSWTFSTGWTHFIYSFDGTNHICYINGVARTINFGSGVGSQTNLYIGNRVNMDSPMKGNIAITRMYNRALSVTEILQNFNAQRTAFGI
jgi:hypothetical protein